MFSFTVFCMICMHDHKYIDRLTPMPRTLLISITLMSIWLKFGETVTQKVGNMTLRSYPGTS